MNLFVFDTETYPIIPGRLIPDLVCVSTAQPGDQAAARLFLKNEGVAQVRAAILRGDTIVGHNVAFDMAVVCNYDESLIPLVFEHYARGLVKDTKIRQELMDIAAGRKQGQDGMPSVFRLGTGWVNADYSLAGLQLYYLQQDRSAEKYAEDTWRLRYGSLDGLPVSQWPADARKYAMNDAAGTLAVYQSQAALGPVLDEDVQVRAAFALTLMSAWGIRTDEPYVTALERHMLAEQARNRRRLVQVGFLVGKALTKKERDEGRVPDFFVPHPKTGEPRPMRYGKDTKPIHAYVERVYERLGRRAPKTETGRVSTDKDVLYESGSRLLRLLADGGGVDKIIQTYLPVLKQGTKVPINAKFRILVNSGRTSCAEPNLQNLPTGRRVAGVRDCFIPRVGFKFVSVDYDTLELRSLAEVLYRLFGHSAMRDAIIEGRDLHVHVAAQILRTTYEDALTRYEAGEAAAKRARDCAKVANFGLPGGLGAATLVMYARKSYGVRITEREAQKLKEDWFKAWPEMRKYFAYKSNQVGLGDASIVSLISGMPRGGVGFCDGCNHDFQNAAAWGAKKALFAVARECYVDLGTALYGTRPVVFVHDEIIAEVPDETATEASLRLAEVMCAEMSGVLENVPATAKPALMDRWLKDAKPVWKGNKLCPWTKDAQANS